MKPQEFDRIKEEKSHLISDAERDENGRLIRYVDGKKIYQSEEKTESDRRFNEACNLWRMRNKGKSKREEWMEEKRKLRIGDKR